MQNIRGQEAKGIGHWGCMVVQSYSDICQESGGLFSDAVAADVQLLLAFMIQLRPDEEYNIHKGGGGSGALHYELGCNSFPRQ